MLIMLGSCSYELEPLSFIATWALGYDVKVYSEATETSLTFYSEAYFATKGDRDFNCGGAYTNIVEVDDGESSEILTVVVTND